MLSQNKKISGFVAFGNTFIRESKWMEITKRSILRHFRERMQKKIFLNVSFKLNMAPKVERILEDVKLGEGPHWDTNTQSLYFVDVGNQTINKYTPSTNKLSKASVAPKNCPFIIPVEGKKNHFVIALSDELAVILWDDESDKISIIEKLGVSKTPGNVFNDAKCDSTGRLWTGTMQAFRGSVKDLPPVGSLYSMDTKRQLKTHDSKILVSNGMAFNEKIKKYYYIDSMKHTIYQYDFDIVNGTVSNRQDLFTLTKHGIPGIPDGMTIDTDGNLWVAIFGGNRVIKIDGQKPETLLETIKLPAEQVTSLCFGGPNLDELYVTTASVEVEGEKAPPPPVHGSTYKITGTGAKGLPAVNFKLH